MRDESIRYRPDACTLPTYLVHDSSLHILESYPVVYLPRRKTPEILPTRCDAMRLVGRECAARASVVAMNRRKHAVLETMARRAHAAAMRAAAEAVVTATTTQTTADVDDDVATIGQATSANTPATSATPTPSATTPTSAEAMAVTAAMRWEDMWEQQPFNMTLAMGALPLGLFLALLGRRHHKTCSFVIVAVFGAWLGMLGVDAVRDVLEDLPVVGDKYQIPDSMYVDAGAALVVALLLNALAVGVFKLFGLCLGVACGYGLSTVASMLIDNLPESVNVGVAIAGGLFGWLFLARYIVNQIGILYAVVGGALVAASSSLFLWVGTVGDSPSLWPFHVYIDSESVNEIACDLSDYSTYIALAIALVVVYIGVCAGGSSKGDAPSESEPLLGDAEKGEAKGEKKGKK